MLPIIVQSVTFWNCSVQHSFAFFVSKYSDVKVLLNGTYKFVHGFKIRSVIMSQVKNNEKKPFQGEPSTSGNGRKLSRENGGKNKPNCNLQRPQQFMLTPLQFQQQNCYKFNFQCASSVTETSCFALPNHRMQRQQHKLSTSSSETSLLENGAFINHSLSRQLSTSSVNNFQLSNNHYCKDNSPKLFSQGSAKGATKLRVKGKKEKLVPPREWEQLQCAAEDRRPGFFFTVMSYNVLAQDLVVEHLYHYESHDQSALKWEVRWPNLLKEISNFKPHIICLQEVQGSHIQDYFSILETQLGYRGIYKKRTGIRTDGCAIYYKENALSLISHTMVEYYHENVSILNRHNVAIVAKLAPKNKISNEFVVATTHLLYNPKRQDVRLAQTQYLFSEIDKMAFKKKLPDGEVEYLPMIITGDLNSTPDSVVYEFFTNGFLHYEYLSARSLSKANSHEVTGKTLVPSWLKISDGCQDVDTVIMREKCSALDARSPNQNHKTFPFSTGILTHEFVLNSVYSHYINGVNEGTTHQGEWITVDYIFYSGKKERNVKVEDKIKLMARYKLPTSDQLDNLRIPNAKLGSDHLSLLAKFKLEY